MKSLEPPIDVCVLGSTNFATGIGMVGFGAAEMFARSFNTGYRPLGAQQDWPDFVTLPNGRLVSVCREMDAARVFVFTGVLWNGVEDFNYRLVPKHGLRLAHVHFDSDRLPSQWVEILNECFDVVMVSSGHMVESLHSSGVNRPVSVIPVALDMDGLLAEPGPTPVGATVRFCSIGAFHPRKGADLLIEGFARAFNNRSDVELTVHSNLSFGTTVDRLQDRVEDLKLENVKISHSHLTDKETQALIRRSHVLVNCSGGEGYSIPPRQALAFGKALVITAVGGHLDLLGPPGVFAIPTHLRVPARYPEIDNALFGQRGQPQVEDIAAQLQAGFEYVRGPNYVGQAAERRDRAAEFTFSRLELPYCELVDSGIRRFRPDAPSHPIANIPVEAAVTATKLVGCRGERLHDPGKRVVLAHDGGFFSVFNVFLSHLVWDLRDPRCHLVLPDWDVQRMMRIRGVHSFTSFCYGRPGDGNLWTKLFEAPYGLPKELLEDESFLWADSRQPEALFNERREPTLTYVHAFRLYRSPDFAAIRRQYHRAFREHVHPLPHLLGQVEAETRSFEGRFMIGAHVRHPSHAVEQPGGAVPTFESYVDRVKALLRSRDLPLDSDGWGVFRATDQDRVVVRFQEEFGDRVHAFHGVRRTRSEEDQRFEGLAAADQIRDGNQLQHLVAADRSSWSPTMAEEVLRDALVLARCKVLLHVVSNVATAVAFMNPSLEMELMLPDGPRCDPWPDSHDQPALPTQTLVV